MVQSCLQAAVVKLELESQSSAANLLLEGGTIPIIKLQQVKAALDTLGLSAAKEFNEKSELVNSLSPPGRFLLVALTLEGNIDTQFNIAHMVTVYNTLAILRHLSPVDTNSLAPIVEQLETYSMLSKVGGSLLGQLSKRVSLSAVKYRLNVSPQQIQAAKDLEAMVRPDLEAWILRQAVLRDQDQEEEE